MQINIIAIKHALLNKNNELIQRDSSLSLTLSYSPGWGCILLVYFSNWQNKCSAQSQIEREPTNSGVDIRGAASCFYDNPLSTVKSCSCRKLFGESARSFLHALSLCTELCHFRWPHRPAVMSRARLRSVAQIFRLMVFHGAQHFPHKQTKRANSFEIVFAVSPISAVFI